MANLCRPGTCRSAVRLVRSLYLHLGMLPVLRPRSQLQKKLVSPLDHLPVRCFFKLPNLNPLASSSKRKQYSERRILGYTMEQMYEIVADVGRYHEFVPWCTSSKVFDVRPNGFKSRMEIGFPPLVEKYNCTITLVHPNLVHSECTEGRLFTQLLTIWRFSPGLPGNSKSCTLDFS
ncbi:unnamed protein product, partial [Candidula unifasciata]